MQCNGGCYKEPPMSNLVQLGSRIPADLKDRVKAVAKREGLRQEQLIALCLQWALDSMESGEADAQAELSRIKLEARGLIDGLQGLVS